MIRNLKFVLSLPACLVVLATSGQTAFGQEANPQSPYVSREEYQKLKAEHDQLKQELESIKALLGKAPPATNVPSPGVDTLKARVDQLEKKQQQQQTETDQSLDQLDKDLKNVVQKTKASIPGTTKMLLAGYGSASFNATSRGYGPSQAPEDTPATGSRPAQNNFFGTLNAIFLYELSPKLLFEGELELETDVGTRTITPNLEQAQLHYLMTDNLTIAAGAFLDPMDYFIERQHMSWVNKLPDRPLAVYDGLLPETQVGVQLRGGVPVGSTKAEFSLFTAMAPRLVLDPAAPQTFGILDFDNYDVNSHLAVGGHVGFYPIPQLEIGYGCQYFNADPVDAAGNSLGGGVSTFLQSADLSYVKDFDPLKGTVNFHAQWVWSHMGNFGGVVDRFNTINGTSFAHFDNNRDGGYAQIAFRPTKVENKILKNLEGVFRYDRISEFHSPLGLDENRYTVGLDYWLGPSTVLKGAYEVDDQHGLSNNPYGNFAENGHSFWLQVAIGF